MCRQSWDWPALHSYRLLQPKRLEGAWLASANPKSGKISRPLKRYDGMKRRGEQTFDGSAVPSFGQPLGKRSSRDQRIVVEIAHCDLPSLRGALEWGGRVDAIEPPYTRDAGYIDQVFSRSPSLFDDQVEPLHRPPWHDICADHGPWRRDPSLAFANHKSHGRQLRLESPIVDQREV